MSGHTPGPWVALIEGQNQQFGECHCIEAGEHGAVVAEVPLESVASTHGEEGESRITEAEAAANARLIAAAPDLLEALHSLSAQLRKRECSIADCKALDIADAAIAKAEGRS